VRRRGKAVPRECFEHLGAIADGHAFTLSDPRRASFPVGWRHGAS
jgi:hypothetical protein